MNGNPRRVVVTGMSVNTPLGDSTDGHLSALLSSRSAITRWKRFDASGIYSKIGGDLTGYDADAKLAVLGLDAASTARRLIRKIPWSVGLSVCLAMDAWIDAGLVDVAADRGRAGVVVAGSDLQHRYQMDNIVTFQSERDFIAPFYAFHSLDTTHVGCVSEALELRGTAMVAGAACASGLYALRVALDEIRSHGAPLVVVVGPVCDFAAIDMHAMGLMGAISQETFDDEPARASRPFDLLRDGFVPAHGGGALILEDFESAKKRNAKIYAEILAVETAADANHLPNPSEEGETLAMQRALESSGIAPDQIDYLNGHFTSTPAGDIAEINAIKRVFGAHAYKLKLNATKSMVGHTMSASAIVELVGSILQMRNGHLHASINIDQLDPKVDLDVCANASVRCPVRYAMKNAFGFGGLNASTIIANPTIGSSAGMAYA
jgi:3-oxoacyl-(acyl-carrier-protein) synthase